MQINVSYAGVEGVLDIEEYCKIRDIAVEDVTNLNCGHNKITEIKGLDKLVNLECLSCVNNKITKLDVSNLVKLEWLWCDSNEITEVKGLDKLVNLKWLHCYNNQLTEINVSKLVNLKVLFRRLWSMVFKLNFRR
jgi:Leucine-rich repeat (LRR) protein